MAARYDMAVVDVGEDAILAVERSTFEDLISQFATSQGDTAEIGQQRDRSNYMSLRQCMWTREQSTTFNSYQSGVVGGSEGQDISAVVKVALMRIDN